MDPEEVEGFCDEDEQSDSDNNDASFQFLKGS